MVHRIFDDVRRREASQIYEYSFSDHTLCVNDVVIGSGGCNAIIVSASDDRTCKVCFTVFMWKYCCRKIDIINEVCLLHHIYYCQVKLSISTICKC